MNERQLRDEIERLRKECNKKEGHIWLLGYVALGLLVAAGGLSGLLS